MKKHLLVLSVVSAIAMLTPIQAQASEIKVTSSTDMIAETDSAVPYADWIIVSYSLSCSKSEKAVKINAKTFASSSMAKLGCKDIVVERSSDNVKWEKEVKVGDKLTTSTSIFSLANYSVEVEGGYYYRVRCKHYAKENGLFGGSQSVENYTDGVWID